MEKAGFCPCKPAHHLQFWNSRKIYGWVTITPPVWQSTSDATSNKRGRWVLAVKVAGTIRTGALFRFREASPSGHSGGSLPLFRLCPPWSLSPKGKAGNSFQICECSVGMIVFIVGLWGDADMTFILICTLPTDLESNSKSGNLQWYYGLNGPLFVVTSGPANSQSTA